MIGLILLFGITILLLIYLNGKYNELYWKQRNVAFYARNKVTGVFWDFLAKDKALFENLGEVYRKHRNDPAVGVGSLLTPTLCIIDPMNVQHVLSSDFNSFNHRGVEMNESDLLADSILFMNGNRWKLMRQNMTPLFTSTKLKSMYYIINKSAIDFVTELKKKPELLKTDTFDTISSFSSAAIGAAVFGLTPKSIFDSPLLDMARDAIRSSFIKNIKFALGNLSTPLFKAFNVNIFKEHEMFFIGTIKKLLRERKLENAKKHDFADLCIQIQNSGNMFDKTTGFELSPTDELLAAQAFFFFVAGVEPTASAIFSTLVELGRHPEYLERAHKEIDEYFELNNNEISYDAVNEMKFLDMALTEAFRLHPPIGFLMRQCIKDTVLPAGNIKVDKGTKIYTPIFEIHHDEQYFSDPEVYNPERFSPENKHNIADIMYMPYGKGKRICVGMRYANLQIKAGLIHLLRHYSVKTNVKEGKIRYKKEQFQVRLVNVDVELIPRQHIK